VRVADLEVIVRQHVHWVLPRIKKAQDPPAPPTERKFLDGEEVRYLGKRLGLRVIDAEKPDHARIIGREYRVTIRTGLGGDERREAVRRVLTDSMREHARLYLPERVRYVADRLDQPVPDVIVCEQDGWVRWDERGAMNVDWRLVQANVYGIQALFARELGTRAGHGPDDEMFWLRVRMMWPDFDERLEQLRVMGEGFVW
jgi:predicted metal-dependent hydrolase